MKLKISLCLLGLFLPFALLAQNQKLNGRVTGREGNKKIALPYTNLKWLNTGKGTIADSLGYYEISKPANGGKLVVSYIGYATDTIEVGNETELDVSLDMNGKLEEVIITENLDSYLLVSMDTRQTQEISVQGLSRMACCNLSESFENNATVDVSYKDAVTGAKQIKMLGLAGVYSQLLTENLPLTRGIGLPYGLEYIPGQWMQAIQVSKGTASVLNGYESVTGQINVEYKKPEHSDPLFVNLYGNSLGSMEANVIGTAELGHGTGTMLMVNAHTMRNRIDNNGDGFLDIPMTDRIHVFNRWENEVEGKRHTQFGVKVLDERRTAGQKNQEVADQNGQSEIYSTRVNTRRYETFFKNGWMFNEMQTKSLGILADYTWHKQDSRFGRRDYDAFQQNAYIDLKYQTPLWNILHRLSTGISYQYDEYDEQLDSVNFSRIEHIPGVYAEYTWEPRHDFTLIGGVRNDYNTHWGNLFTPRLHGRYELDESSSIRLSAGRGFRAANVLAEHTGVLVSSRMVVFSEEAEIEEAWNYGLNYSKCFEFEKKRDITLSLDYYRTDFVNQVVMNVDRSADYVYFYNLDGQSYSNSFQAEALLKLIKGLETTFAYRLNDVKTSYDGELREKPLVSRHKAIAVFSYRTPADRWQFDLTGAWHGPQRLPSTDGNPEEYQLDEEAPAFAMLHAQIIFKPTEAWEFYVGGENLNDFIQDKPILAYQDPYGEHFDASMVWGPLLGRRFYFGLRYTIEKQKEERQQR